MTTCKISRILCYEDEVKPVSIHFENSKQDDETTSNSLPCGFYEQDDGQRKVALCMNKQLYVGDVEDSEEYNNFIAIRNKVTNEITLVAVNNATVAATVLKRKRTSVNAVSPALSKAALNKQFGSKKAKRITEQYERMQMNTENVAQVLEKTVASIEVKENDLIQADTVDDASYKPPINREASTVEDVYNVKNLVPLSVLAESAEDISSVLESDEASIRENLCAFVSEQVLRIKNGSSSADKLQVLIYVDCLIKMLGSHSKMMNAKKFNPSPNFAKLGNYILNNFTLRSSNNSRTRPNSMRDKTICYILVLTTLMCDYKLNLELLSKDLKIGVKKLGEIARFLSLTPSKFNKFVELKLPLPVPFVPNAAGRRGKR